MIKRFKAKRAAKKRAKLLAAYRAEIEAARKSGLAKIVEQSKKYFPDDEKRQKEYQQRSLQYWYGFLPMKEQETYLRTAEAWYRLKFNASPDEILGADLTYTGVTKIDLIELEDFRERMWNALYPDEVESHMKAIQVQEDTHADVTFVRREDGKSDVYRNGVLDEISSPKKG